MSQEPVLFHGTVADNVRLGRPDATDQEASPRAPPEAPAALEKLAVALPAPNCPQPPCRRLRPHCWAGLPRGGAAGRARSRAIGRRAATPADLGPPGARAHATRIRNEPVAIGITRDVVLIRVTRPIRWRVSHAMPWRCLEPTAAGAAAGPRDGRADPAAGRREEAAAWLHVTWQ